MLPPVLPPVLSERRNGTAALPHRHVCGIPHFYAEGAVVSPVAPVGDPYLERAIEIDEQLEQRRRRRRSEGEQETLA